MRLTARILAAEITLSLCFSLLLPAGAQAAEKLSRVSPGIYRLFSDDSTIKGVYRRGVDVAHYQGSIDWKTAKANDIDFVMLGTRYRGEVDPLFDENAKGAEAAGVDIGVYIYSYATSVEMAEQEADFVLNLIKDYPISYPVAFDAENAETLGLQPKDKITDIVNAFCKKISDAGYYPILYANENWVKTKLDMNALSKYPLWVAIYEREYTQKQAFMWQGTESGSVPGINGDVDIDLQFTDLSDRCPANLWRRIDGVDYYYENYRMAKDRLINDGKHSYYMDSDGKISYGWKTIDGKKRYFEEGTGIMCTGWKELDGKRYYFQADGTLGSGWVNENGNWYYVSGDGTMLAGVQNIGEVLYDLGTDGIMKHDLVVSWGGKDYTIDASGAMHEGVAETAAAQETAPAAEASEGSAANGGTAAPQETGAASGGVFYVEAIPSAVSESSESGSGIDSAVAGESTANGDGTSLVQPRAQHRVTVFAPQLLP